MTIPQVNIAHNWFFKDTVWFPICIEYCCLESRHLFRKDAIEKAGYFNKKYFVYYDDTEICIKMRKLGYKNVYVPSAKVWHNCKVNVTSTPFTAYHFMRSKVIFMKEITNNLQYLFFLSIFFSLYLPLRSIKYLFNNQIDLSKLEYTGALSGLKANFNK